MTRWWSGPLDAQGLAWSAVGEAVAATSAVAAARGASVVVDTSEGLVAGSFAAIEHELRGRRQRAVDQRARPAAVDRRERGGALRRAPVVAADPEGPTATDAPPGAGRPRPRPPPPAWARGGPPLSLFYTSAPPRT